MLQEGILCDVYSQKYSAAWQGAPVGIMLPGRQNADDWLNFMLSQKNLWPALNNPGHPRRGNLSTGIQQRAAKAAGPTSLEGGQVMVGCCLTECTSMHPRGNPKKNSMLCSLTRPPDATAQTLTTRKGIVGLESRRSKHGGRLAKIGWHSLKNKVYRLSMISRRYREIYPH